MNILVTGGAGFIGSHLTDELINRRHNVTVIDNLINGKIENLSNVIDNKNFNFIKGNILFPDDCVKAFKQIDIVYHLACLGVRHSLYNPLENHEVNATGTLNILETARNNKTKKVFYISSSEIYGKVKNFPINESDTPVPITVYGSSKLAGENYTNSYFECFGLDTTIVRLFNNFGPYSHYEGDSGELIPRTIVNILYGKPPVIYGDGLISKDFLFVRDTARILADLMDLENISGEIYNIGFGKEITVTNLIEMILNLMDKKDMEIKYIESRPADVPRLLVDNSKLRAKLKYSTTPLKDGLLETINYFKKLSLTKNLLKDTPEINWK